MGGKYGLLSTWSTNTEISQGSWDVPGAAGRTCVSQSFSYQFNRGCGYSHTKLSLQVFVDITRALDISADDLLSESTPARRDQYADILAVLDTCGVQEVKILTDMVKSMKISLDKYT